MQQRIDAMKVAPAAYKAMAGLQGYVDQSGLERSLLELVKIRTSQINGCAFCLVMHTNEARKLGETDDRMQADGLGCADETDGAVEAVVVRDGQAGQPESDGPLDQLVRCRRTIEEREVGVAMEFGVRGRCHGSLRSGSRLTGGSSL